MFLNGVFVRLADCFCVEKDVGQFAVIERDRFIEVNDSMVDRASLFLGERSCSSAQKRRLLIERSFFFCSCSTVHEITPSVLCVRQTTVYLILT